MAATHAPVEGLRIIYGVAMMGLAYVLATGRDGETAKEPVPALVADSQRTHPPCGHGAGRVAHAADGKVYKYCAHGLGLQRVLSGVGAFLAGLISTGVGEATLPPLVRRSRLPAPVAAATSTMIVAGTVLGAQGSRSYRTLPVIWTMSS